MLLVLVALLWGTTDALFKCYINNRLYYSLCVLVNLTGSVIFFFLSNKMEIAGLQTLANSLSLISTTLVSSLYLRNEIKPRTAVGICFVLLGVAVY